MGRRGIPETVTSDNATTFKAAAEVATNAYKIESFLAKKRIKWYFNTAAAPWEGGVWEKMVGLVKKALKHAIGEQALSRKDFETIVVECESIVNQRPLTYSGETENEAIRPIDLISPKIIFPTYDEKMLNDEYLEYTYRFREVLKHVKRFWQVFCTDYQNQNRIYESVKFGKKAHSNKVIPVVGEIVLVKSDQKPRNKWKMARVVELKPGSDGISIEKSKEKEPRKILKAEEGKEKGRGDVKERTNRNGEQKTYAAPNTEDIFEKFKCEEWGHQLVVSTSVVTNGEETREEHILAEGEIETMMITGGQVSIELTGIGDESGLAVMGKSFLQKEEQISLASEAVEELALECNEELKCKYRETCNCNPGGDEANCQCSEVDLYKILEHKDYKLPIITEKYQLAVTKDKTPVLRMKHNKVHLRVNFNQKYNIAVTKSEVDCEISEYSEFKGCYHCNQGAVQKIICKASKETHAKLSCNNTEFIDILTCNEKGFENEIYRKFEETNPVDTCKMNYDDGWRNNPNNQQLQQNMPGNIQPFPQNQVFNHNNKPQNNFQQNYNQSNHQQHQSNQYPQQNNVTNQSNQLPYQQNNQSMNQSNQFQNQSNQFHNHSNNQGINQYNQDNQSINQCNQSINQPNQNINQHNQSINQPNQSINQPNINQFNQNPRNQQNYQQNCPQNHQQFNPQQYITNQNEQNPQNYQQQQYTPNNPTNTQNYVPNSPGSQPIVHNQNDQQRNFPQHSNYPLYPPQNNPVGQFFNNIPPLMSPPSRQNPPALTGTFQQQKEQLYQYMRTLFHRAPPHVVIEAIRVAEGILDNNSIIREEETGTREVEINRKYTEQLKCRLCNSPAHIARYCREKSAKYRRERAKELKMCFCCLNMDSHSLGECKFNNSKNRNRCGLCPGEPAHSYNLCLSLDKDPVIEAPQKPEQSESSRGRTAEEEESSEQTEKREENTFEQGQLPSETTQSATYQDTDRKEEQHHITTEEEQPMEGVEEVETPILETPILGTRDTPV
ncbi:hypothetical protein B9Z55_017494 [Caenorhabditis nigoni]|uniref:Integrase catalytic domain-containing protein n=1 Tax=Caenorhabditis nigoni TaxID=1611254 RepID=A0A2G5T9D7_9PELO|nr:hypothetical protein B9Z55_017494 [Caenorhabditis nigoni]